MIILRKEFSDKKKDSSKKVEKVAAGTAIASGVTSVGLAAGQNAEEKFRGKLIKKLDKATDIPPYVLSVISFSNACKDTIEAILSKTTKPISPVSMAYSII